MNRWWIFLVLSVGLLTGPAVTAISYALPSTGNDDKIDQDGKVKEKAAEAKEKWEKKKDKGDDGGSDNNDSGDSGGNDSGSDDSSGDSGGDSGDDSSDGGSSDESGQEDSSEESGSEDDAGEEGSDDESGEEDNSDETAEEEVVEEEVVEETVEPTEEEVVEEPVEEYPEGTFPDSYFADKPLERFQLQKYHVTDPDGNRLMSLKGGKEVEIDYSFRNVQQKEQTYVMIAQIIDHRGVTIDMGWYIDTIQSGELADWYGFWTPEEPGLCTIKIMVWDGVDDNPAPLAKITKMTVLVH